ncbi:hypothetical protein [Nonomuraea solani]|uniref:hypothetical protein n=1 Tax=Nonomuraea solani TaxID=1144553 RepID=UPI00190EF106|nr:hypothetical protein [Nonomuraea solani]
MSHDEQYGFVFDDRYRPLLGVLGIGPRTCGLTLTPQALHVRFGPWVVRTPLSNVAGAELSGPYSPLKAIGVRVSLADRGLTFGTSTEQGACVRFHRPVRGSDPLGLLTHPALTVTVESPARLVERLRRDHR